MAKTKRKPKGEMMSKANDSGNGRGRGALTIEERIKRLKAEMSQEDVKAATILAAGNATIVKLAYRLIPRPGKGLNMGQEKHYQLLLGIDKSVAEKFKTQVLA